MAVTPIAQAATAATAHAETATRFALLRVAFLLETSSSGSAHGESLERVAARDSFRRGTASTASFEGGGFQRRRSRGRIELNAPCSSEDSRETRPPGFSAETNSPVDSVRPCSRRGVEIGFFQRPSVNMEIAPSIG